MPLRQALEEDVPRLHQQVDDLLDSEDGFIVLVDGRRAISYSTGFGLSASQLELLATDIERVIRTAAGKQRPRKEAGKEGDGRGQSSSGARVGQHRGDSHGRVLQLANKIHSRGFG